MENKIQSGDIVKKGETPVRVVSVSGDSAMIKTIDGKSTEFVNISDLAEITVEAK